MNYLENPMVMTISLFAGIGLVTAIIISMLDQGKVRGGLMTSIILGILGGLIGGLLANTLLQSPIDQPTTENMLLALAGSVVAIMLQRLFMRETGHIRTTTTNI